MKIKIFIILSCLLIVSYILADPPSSSNYTLVQCGVLVGNPNQVSPPSSANYELKETSMLEITTAALTSTGYIHYPGFLQPNSPAPSNVTISVNGSQIIINWDAVDGANSYKVYSSDDPESGFELDTSGTFNGASWSTSVINEKKFYYVTAIN